ncbi:hypothetical protein EAH75_00480 [Rhodanobacter glycinis]|nr:hypothetical protein EAH75_00480 [Rhodanobacter glycinis]
MVTITFLLMSCSFLMPKSVLRYRCYRERNREWSSFQLKIHLKVCFLLLMIVPRRSEQRIVFILRRRIVSGLGCSNL